MGGYDDGGPVELVAGKEVVVCGGGEVSVRTKGKVVGGK